MTTLLLALLLACAPTPNPPDPPAADQTATEAPTATDADTPPVDEAPDEAATDEPTDAEDPDAEADPETEPAADPEPGEPLGSAGPKPGGASCSVGTECASGVCEGEGCGDDAPGTCAPEMRACTRDLRQYCGCDGETFAAGGNCPLRRYAHKGPCKP